MFQIHLASGFSHHTFSVPALESKVGEMTGGGECKPSQYVHYTHECRVQDYLPSIDFCCCQLEAKVLCCRYHQDWDRFRCSEADDTIDQE